MSGKKHASKQKSQAEAAEAELHCDGSVWILYSRKEEWHQEISREAHKRQTEEQGERTTAEGKHRLHYVVAHLDKLSLTWMPARKIA